MTVAQRMMLLTGVIVFGITVVIGTLLYMLERVYESANAGNANVVPSLVILDELREGVLETRNLLRTHILSDDDGASSKIENQLTHYKNQVDDKLNSYEFNGCGGQSCLVDDKDANYLKEIKSHWQRYALTLPAMLSESRKLQADLVKSRALIAQTQTVALEKQISVLIDEHIKYNIELAKRSSDAGTATKRIALFVSAALGFVLIGGVFLLGMFTRRAILKILGGEPATATLLVKQIAEGDLRFSQDLQHAEEDSLLANVKTMRDNLEVLARQADKVGRGDLSVEVVARSDADRLGHAFKNMVDLLRLASKEDQERNWLKDGINQLNQQLTGDLSSQQVVDIAIASLGRYLNAGRGVLYLWRSSTEQLDLLGSYMYTERNQVGSHFQLGEGAVGQVARERKPIILTTLNNDGAPIVTGTSCVQPLYTYTYPLLRDETLLGVIELASVERYDEVKVRFLSNAVETIASYLYVAEQQSNIRELLIVAEKAELEARTQSEYLQLANSQMEEQQQQLQQQSEELRQTNDQMQEQQRLLEQNNESLRLAQAETAAKAQQLEQSGQYKTEFLANMSHELRTPLNAIILLSKMMMKNADATLLAEDVKRAEVIHRSGRDLLGLINDVLDLSKIEAGRMELSTSSLSSSAFTQNLQDLFSAIAEERGVKFEIEDNYAGEIHTDQDKLAQILRNLLSNAFKFTKQGQVKLRIDYRATDSLPIRIAVIDSGIGIPLDRQQAIFEAFRQGDGSTSREYGGTGLGLTISLRIAQLLGGTIELKSTMGQGSTFCLCLPKAPPATDTSPGNPTQTGSQLSTIIQPQAQTRPPLPKSKLSGSDRRASADIAQQAINADDRENLQAGDKVILLIDDDHDFGVAVIDINRRLGYKTLLATTGADGLAYAAKYRPGGILLDLGLPDMDGISLLQELKTTQELAAIPVYIVSARDRDQIQQQHDIVGFLQKPIDSEALAEAERRLLPELLDLRSDAILILSNGGIDASEVRHLFQLEHKPIPEKIQEWTEHALSAASLTNTLLDYPWSLCIIDLTGRSVEQGMTLAATVRQTRAELALMFFSSASLSDETEARLRPYSDSIIVKTSRSPARLLDNIEYFLQNINQNRRNLRDNKLVTSNQKRLVGATILVVDDDLRNLFVVTQALEQNGAKVVTAVNGRQALEVLEKNQVGLIFMDIMMPEMDGYQAIAGIRANPKFRNTGIVALSAKAMLQDRQNIINAGANDYLSKPVDYDDLITMAEKWTHTTS